MYPFCLKCPLGVNNGHLRQKKLTEPNLNRINLPGTIFSDENAAASSAKKELGITLFDHNTFGDVELGPERTKKPKYNCCALMRLGSTRDPPPPGQKFFNFMQFTGKCTE